MPIFSPPALGLIPFGPIALFAAISLSLPAESRAVDALRSDRGALRADSPREGNDEHAAIPRQPKSAALGSAGLNAAAPKTAAEIGPTLPLASKRLPPPVGEAASKASGWSTLLSALGSLAVVLGLFLGVVWFLRRTGPKSMTLLPGEVFEILGRSPLAARQQAQLVRCGNKLLLLAVTAGGAETLTEITDPAEVERLTGLCQQTRPNSATASFRNLFSQFTADSPAPTRPVAGAARFGLRRLPRTSTEVADA